MLGLAALDRGRNALMSRLFLALALLCAGCGCSMKVPAGGNSGHDAGMASDAACTYDPRVPPPANCPNDVPSACVDPAPSYRSTITAVIATRCQPCHRAGGLAPDKLFDTYAQVYKARTTMLNRVTRCIMPPACAPQPTPTERHDLLQWLVCDAPNN